MVITKKRLSRRTVLRGLGVSIGLPLLDGMIPAFAAGPQRVKRLGAVYTPNGMSMPYWTPKGAGSLELSPILEPLAPVRNHVVVLSGLSNKDAFPLIDEGDGDHSRCQAAYLTSAHAHKASAANATLNVGVSMDQIVARQLEKETQLASLELSLESNDLGGQCEDGYGCAYSATIAWRNATTPLPMESNPRAVFEHLFGASQGTDREARLRQLQADKSFLDSIADELASLRRTLGRGDRRKLAGYLDSIRDIERRIQIAETQSNLELPELPRPAGIPAKFEDYANVMFDLWTVAFQADLTRVCTFLYGREKSVRTYPEIGVSDPHHPVSHHQNRPTELERLYKINKFHVQLFTRFVEKLRATPDGDGSLLDNSVILYGAGMSNSNGHVPKNLPLLLAGGAAGRIKGGRHLQMPADTPMANLHLTLMDKMGVAVEKFADSTSGLDVLSEV